MFSFTFAVMFMKRSRFRYRFDNLMSRGTPALLVGLVLATATIIAIVSTILIVFDLSPHDSTPVSEIVWTTFMHTYDPSQIAYDEGDWVYKLVVFIACLGGLFILSALIGVLTTGFDNRIQELRKGKSPVIESGHTLILGWSKQIFHTIGELVIANANRRDACVVILAEEDKLQMEDMLRLKIPALRSTRIVCRTGSPMDLTDLEIVSPNEARSIIILPPDDDPRPDISVIKTILALVNNPRRKKEKYSIVAMLADETSSETVRLIAKDEAHIVLSDVFISKLITQTCRQPGLSNVYTEFLDFDGDELYFQQEDRLVGTTFGEALFRYEDSTLIGLRCADGRILINPPGSTVIQQGDSVIALSRDDDTIVLSGKAVPALNTAAIAEGARSQRKPERTLICGWNTRVPVILTELEKYVAPGSVATVLCNCSADEALAGHLFSHLSVQIVRGDTTSRKTLMDIGCTDYDNIIVVSYDMVDIQEADAITLMTLVQLRDLAERSNKSLAVVSEMMDDRNRELASVTSANDFIVSNKINALLLAQISENPELAYVFAELLSAEGSEIYMKPATEYIQPGVSVNFYTLVESARRRGEIALGYKTTVDGKDSVRVNPPKSQERIYQASDLLIVLAEE